MITIDACALVKMVLREEHSEEVKALVYKELLNDEPLVMPDIALAEVLNTLWKAYSLKHIIESRIYASAIKSILLIWEKSEIITTIDIAPLASELAVEKHLSFYDALYLATSIIKGASLLTFDDELANAAKGLGVEILKV